MTAKPPFCGGRPNSMLQIYIPENWIEAKGEAPCPWVKRDNQANKIDSGLSLLKNVPRDARVQVILPASRVLLTTVTLPARNRQKLLQALPFAVEEFTGSEPESLHVALGERLSGEKTAVAVVDKIWFGTLLALLSNHGFIPNEIFAETLLPKINSGEWVTVIGAQNSFVRQSANAGLSLDAVAGGAPPFALKLALNEASKSALFPQKIVVRRDGNVKLDLGAWSEELGVACVEGSVWNWAEVPNSASINLLQGEFAARKVTRQSLRRFKPVFVLTGLILLLQFGASVTDWIKLSQEKKQLNLQMTKEFRAAFPQAQAVIDPSLQMQRNLADLRRARGVMGESDFLPLLARVAPALDGATKKIHYTNGVLTLDTTVADNQVAQALLSKLNANGVSAKLEASSQKADFIEARFRVEARR